ncbi:vacuolar family H+-ATPase subunit H [Lachnospiraceae bacterium HCP1S3_A8]|jgi:vacuolar-type H+-ATPase subunit H|nr:vacuolar family H+-ATPase subunit H [Lachnospiraceae bacterium]RHQ19798.1 vacuolar family H+-ATPase subunit H [Lachnospiraceae bacterium AM48-27BH]
MSRIEQLIGEIEEYIDGCKFQPLSNTKILVNKEELEELLVELRLRIPDEIKQYQKIISNQDAILTDARTQADAMIEKATAQTNELVNEHEIMQRAYEAANQVIEDANNQAQTIVDAAVRDADNIRQGAVQYTQDMLKSVENIINHTMEGAQGRFDSFMSSLKSSYDIVSANRAELDHSIQRNDEAAAAEPEQQNQQ